MRVLVTGASGFIGRNLTAALAGEHDVLAPSRAELDLIDERSVDRYLHAHAVDAVVHCATKPGHRNAPDPTGLVDANTRMFLNLTRDRSACGRIVLLTSGAVYDQRHYAPRMSEDRFGAHVPVDETGYSKYVLGRYAELLDDIVELRPFGVFGPHEDWEIRFVSNAICKALLGFPITLRQNRRFSYLWVGDLAEIVRRVLGGGLRRGVFNATPGETVELLDVAKRVRARARRPVELRVAHPGLGIEYTGDSTRLRAALPDLRFTSLDDAIDALWNWYEERRSLIDPVLLRSDK
jgi:GDP-L-fucose synthase